MNIALIGQCTLHWGRMEFGNIGNYYIIEPFIKELKRKYPNAVIKTTFQMTEYFCEKEGVEVVPMDSYYGWKENYLDLALAEVASAAHFSKYGELLKRTPFIDLILGSDLVIDFSGDIWGDNANLVGKDRLLVGLCKDRTAQLLKKPVVMLAGSPGPFSSLNSICLAKEVYKNFDIITNREPISKELMEQYGFHNPNVHNFACPSFLFQPAPFKEINGVMEEFKLLGEKPIIGIILCGWNFTEGPFDKWPRDDNEYSNFVEMIGYLSETTDAKIVLMSHSNGFDIPPAPFKLKHGRDYPIVKQLYKIITEKGGTRDIILLDGIYNAWQTKALIGQFSMLVSGRIHAAVAGLSQFVPTVVIDYGHEPKAHKLKGFAKVVKVEQYVANPASTDDLIEKVSNCWKNRLEYVSHLKRQIPEVQMLARQNFEILDSLKIFK